MEIVARRDYEKPPDVSVILLDWTCRESFHILDYFDRQDVDRDRYEVIWIEYWDRRAGAIEQALARAGEAGRAAPIDTWIILHQPAEAYYHKHLMYNVGIALARGRIVTIMDSDAFFKPSFIPSIIDAFQFDPPLVLHHDQVRNLDKRFYPFNHPDFDDVIGEGAINWTGTCTTGVADTVDPLHSRNYGACMSALRRDLIAVGGADEHLDYLGHICGPYDLTFRLVNHNRRQRWHESEFIYHVWHPGQAGDDNFGGPHDGRHMSTRALATLTRRQVQPAVENPAIRLLRTRAPGWDDPERVQAALIDPERTAEWVIDHGDTETVGQDSWGHQIRMRRTRTADEQAEAQPEPPPRRRRSPVPLPSVDQVVYQSRTDREDPQLRFATKVRLWAVMVLLVVRQMMGLRTDPGFPRPRGRLGRRLRRLSARHRYWMRRCWHRMCIAYLNGADEIAFYGDGGYIRVGRILAGDLPVRVCGVIPCRPTRRTELAGMRVLRDEQVKYVRGYVLLTSLLDKEAAYRRLEAMELPRQRVMPLR
ncbi:MAG TPA: glycosyltransferase [Phycisphaerae bacterium]|nr:glycosyltransferase [Phycisphaerae bacterium]